jgi:hypothetical protein
MANPPDEALQGAITHDFQTEGYYRRFRQPPPCVITQSAGRLFAEGSVPVEPVDNGRHPLPARRSLHSPNGSGDGRYDIHRI